VRLSLYYKQIMSYDLRKTILNLDKICDF
jgi:hypothetical protein